MSLGNCQWCGAKRTDEAHVYANPLTENPEFVELCTGCWEDTQYHNDEELMIALQMAEDIEAYNTANAGSPYHRWRNS